MYNRQGLVVTDAAEPDNMFCAAMKSKGCKLTPLGKHYRRLAAEHKIWSLSVRQCR
jgi:hypothetical protein